MHKINSMQSRTKFVIKLSDGQVFSQKLKLLNNEHELFYITSLTLTEDLCALKCGQRTNPLTPVLLIWCSIAHQHLNFRLISNNIPSELTQKIQTCRQKN